MTVARKKAASKKAKKKAARKKTKKKTTRKAARKVVRKKTKTRPAADGEPTAERRARARKALRRLKSLYPVVECALHHDSAFQLLVATILSAQSTDNNVNKVTPTLFARYPTPHELATAKPAAVEKIIHSTGFFRQKRKNIQGAALRIVEEFGGEVPDTIEDLVSLPGVARKTANVVLGTWFGKNDGVVVDTHVGRLAHRLDLTWTSKDTKDAVKIERDLMQVIPRKEWTYISHALIWHGRGVCPARRPKCEECPLNGFCPAAFDA